jgi:hypothetical protein
VRRLWLAFALVVTTTVACGPDAQGKGKRVPIGLESPDETPGDAVTGSPSAPTSPGINGPSRPGGPGAGGGTAPQR